MSEAIKKAAAFAKKFALSKGFTLEQAEDFSQDFLIVRHVKKTTQTVEQALIDFYRKEFGSYQSNKGTAKSRAVFLSGDEQYNSVPCTRLSCEENLSEASSRQRKLKLLNPRQRAIVDMLADGLTSRRIAEIFQVTEPAISHHLTKIKNEMSFVVDLNKSLQVNWITI
jgi:DNA-binding CsgD family transcriptional regulator